MGRKKGGFIEKDKKSSFIDDRSTNVIIASEPTSRLKAEMQKRQKSKQSLNLVLLPRIFLKLKGKSQRFK